MSTPDLPLEILIIIFKTISKKDLKSCEVVCRSWRRAALSLLNGLSIKVANNQLGLLAKDLKEYPSIGGRISCLTITKDPYDSASAVNFMAVVNACSGSLELHFDTLSASRYLEMLYSAKTVVPDLKNICICGLDEGAVYNEDGSPSSRNLNRHSPPATTQLYLKVNFRFRASITSIYVVVNDEGYNGMLKDHDGMIEYVASFPLLQSLKAQCSSSQECGIDISELLDRSPRLTYLQLYGFSFIMKGVSLDKHACSPLTHLMLISAKSDINLLKFLMSRFKKLQYIELKLEDLLPCPSLTEDETDGQLQEFVDYAEAIDNYHICYAYEENQTCKDNTDSDCIHEERFSSSTYPEDYNPYIELMEEYMAYYERGDLSGYYSFYPDNWVIDSD